MDPHPERKELIEAAKQEVTPLSKHLDKCDDCRLLFNFYRHIPAGGLNELPSAPSIWIERAGTICTETSLANRVKRFRARLSFDSWASLPAIAMRNAPTNVRRLSYDCGGNKLEIQGTKRPTDWQFVARFVDEGIGHEAAIRLGKDSNVFPDEDGYFIWTNIKPETALVVTFRDEVYDITDIEW